PAPMRAVLSAIVELSITPMLGNAFCSMPPAIPVGLKFPEMVDRSMRKFQLLMPGPPTLSATVDSVTCKTLRLWMPPPVFPEMVELLEDDNAAAPADPTTAVVESRGIMG